MMSSWQCACCGGTNDVFIDPAGGDKQEFVEDCGVCCRPNVITAAYNEYRSEFDISTYQEDKG